MTMNMTSKVMAAGKFKAQCLEVLDRVARTGEPVVVTKRGRPVARVVPVPPAGAASLRGSIIYHGDVVGPVDDRWETEQ